MKHLTLSHFLLLAACTSTLKAQFPSFPDSNAHWLMGYYEQAEFQYSYGYHFRSADHDTLLNGVWYSSLWAGVEGQGGAFAGGIRTDTDARVYYFHPNTDAEYLLYDFDPVLGDSMEVWTGESTQPSASLTQMHVASLEVLANGNGTAYRRIGILSDLGVQMVENVSNYWIEGVGGSEGLLSTDGTEFTPFAASALECMQYNDTLWPDGLPGECWPTGVMNGEPAGVKTWFHPTVTLDMLYFDIALVPRLAEVLSMDGRLASSPMVMGNTVSVAALKPGGYVLRTVDQQGLVRRGRFLKE